MYHYTDGDLRNVWLRNGYEMHETPYGKAVSFQDGDGLIRAVCLALTRKVGRLTGVEFRHIGASGFLTKTSWSESVSQIQLADATPPALSNDVWEHLRDI